ncbi:hypothetical protein AB0K09_01405 [Streptomyces sp. NPDC049577]|uniref:hypothetical protein n=1 Tax=Streptomyces sp. NPDC049577 TaxID=3155153 RepID=UPI0034162E8D
MTAAATATPRIGTGLVRLVLRQHRFAAWAALAVLVALVVELVWLRSAMTGYLDAHHLRTACTPDGVDCDPAAYSYVVGFRSTYGDALHYNGLLLELLPLAVGAFVAGPMVARELESGTYKFAWTQGITPASWLATKLAVPAVALLGGLSLLAAVYTWCWHAAPAALLPGQVWYLSFDMLGPAPVADALLAVAVGALVGLLARRTVRAMAVALAGVYAALSVTGDWLRRMLVSPVTDLSADVPGLVRANTWIVERGLVTASGGRAPEPSCEVGAALNDCAARAGARGWYLDYHPQSHFWPLQWTHTAVTLALAVTVATTALYWTRRR